MGVLVDIVLLCMGFIQLMSIHAHSPGGRQATVAYANTIIDSCQHTVAMLLKQSAIGLIAAIGAFAKTTISCTHPNNVHLLHQFC